MIEGEIVADIISGYIEKIVFRNEENGYTVLSLVLDDDEITCVGNFVSINEGEYVEMSGNYTDHYTYGEQFLVETYEIKEPEDVKAIERYLGSGAIKGVGPVLANRIVKKFSTNTFNIIENEPELLATIKGISKRIAMDIYKQFDEKRSIRSAMMFLQEYGIAGNMALKIYNFYGEKIYEILKTNPYKMAEDIVGIGFVTADEIAVKVGINKYSEPRIEAGILYGLMQGNNQGHIYLPEEKLVEYTRELLAVESNLIKIGIENLILNRKINIITEDNDIKVYLAPYYYMELNIARMLKDLNIMYNKVNDNLDNIINTIERNKKIELDQMQKRAIIESSKNGVLIITGGPGTGKTTTINAIIEAFEHEGLNILLAAPTGRAAKRMSETTGYEAKTIHRLLELSKMTDELSNDNNKYTFERNEMNPLDTDVIIIDEMSMVDINLMHHLLKAIPIGTRLILVGDVNQLPSVGPGNILKDIIQSNQFGVVKLSKIFRQAAESDIIINAHKINNGEHFDINNKSKDFFLFEQNEADKVISVMIYLIKDRLPNYVKATPQEIQVLTPMRKGELGVERLNRILQKALNPPSVHKKEKESNQVIFREGDKVMQVKNNYQLNWEITKNNVVIQNGTGVFNGDCGKIVEINLFSERLYIEYEDSRMVEYNFSQLEELDLAYAITIHKSQGSEYPAVVMPILNGPRLLFNRNILYTAVTRARHCVTIVGSNNMIQNMIANKNEQMRYSNLDKRIKSIE